MCRFFGFGFHKELKIFVSFRSEWYNVDDGGRWEVADRDHILHFEPQEVVRPDSRLIVMAFVVTEVTQ